METTQFIKETKNSNTKPKERKKKPTHGDQQSSHKRPSKL